MPAYVHEARVELEEGTEPAAVGAAVTVALCGQWVAGACSATSHATSRPASRSWPSA
jgi:hypothetical protein